MIQIPLYTIVDKFVEIPCPVFINTELAQNLRLSILFFFTILGTIALR